MMKATEKVKETRLQTLDILCMQTINGGSIIPPGTYIDPTTCILRDRYRGNPWLIYCGTGENAA